MEQADNGTSWSSTALRELGRWICGAKGHTLMRHFEPDHICLVCTSCGHRSPGWEVKSLPYAVAGHAPSRFPAPALTVGALGHQRQAA